ncbi:MAG: FAD-binding protein [Deferribacteraceae bacterium]|jgi:flavin-dependent dehydrogenase|nr:FAD-binding protein [Deferribacteraceae bacterium]
MYDLIIIGGGPAGATLARLLKGMKVALIDKKLHSAQSGAISSFQKPCGGLLSPDAQHALANIGLHLPASVLVKPQPSSVKTIDLNSGLVRHYPRNYINMDRHKFDMWLLSLVPETVTCFAGRCTKIEQDNGEYVLTLIAPEEPRQLRAKYIVGADGAYSIVRRTIMPYKSRIKKYTAIQQWFLRDASEPSDYIAAFDNSLTDSYAWGLDKDEHFIFGAALPAKNAKHDFEALKEKMCAYGYSFSKLVKTECCQVLTPLHFSDTFSGNGNAFLIGEAGGFISPSSLEGISYALNTAAILAKVLMTEPEPNRLAAYKKNLLGLRLKLMLKQLKMPFMYNKQLRRLVMKSGVTAVK